MHKHPTFAVQASQNPSTARPFLKWSGGKRHLLSQLLPYLPPGRRLVEPFVGAGSVFLATDYDAYLHGDANPDLANVLRFAQQNPQGLIESLRNLFVPENLDEDAFREARRAFNHSKNSLQKAALFVYLNRFGINGLCRYNRRGELNTPHGKPMRLPKVPIDAIETFARRAQSADIQHADFLDILDRTSSDDVVYCDSPYLDSEYAKSFTGYTASRFSLQRHQVLAGAAKTLSHKGITVVISNHNTTVARDLYRDAELHLVTVRRSISASSASRGSVSELIAVYR